MLFNLDYFSLTVRILTRMLKRIIWLPCSFNCKSKNFKIFILISVSLNSRCDIHDFVNSALLCYCLVRSKRCINSLINLCKLSCWLMSRKSSRSWWLVFTCVKTQELSVNCRNWFIRMPIDAFICFFYVFILFYFLRV